MDAEQLCSSAEHSCGVEHLVREVCQAIHSHVHSGRNRKWLSSTGQTATAIGSTYPCIKSSTSSVTSPDGFPETSWPLTKDIGPSCWEMRGFLSSASYTLGFFLTNKTSVLEFFYWGAPSTKLNRHSYGMRPVGVMGLARLVVAIAGTRSPAEPTLVLLAWRDRRCSECRVWFHCLRSVS